MVYTIDTQYWTSQDAYGGRIEGPFCGRPGSFREEGWSDPPHRESGCLFGHTVQVGASSRAENSTSVMGRSHACC